MNKVSTSPEVCAWKFSFHTIVQYYLSIYSMEVLLDIMHIIQ